MDDYGDAMRMLSERPELYAFQLELFNRSQLPLGREQKSYSREEMVIRNYVIMLYGFFERVHFPLQTEMDRRGYLEAMGSVSRSCCRTPCIQGGSSVVQRNVQQAIPRLCLWNPRPQEMKQTTLASGMAFDSLDWSLFFCFLYEFNDGIWLEKQASFAHS